MNLIPSQIYFYGLYSWLILSFVTFLFLLLFKPATYGRHIRDQRLTISNKWGWFIMELPTFLIIPIFLMFSDKSVNLVTICFISLYVIHYINRVFVFPFRLNTKEKKNTTFNCYFCYIF